MKHDVRVTIALITLFLGVQFIGLYVANAYIEDELPYNIEKPEYDQQTSFVPIFIIIIFVTFLVILLARFKAFKLWKIMFFLGIWFSLLIAFGAFVADMIALVLALTFAGLRLFKNNVIIHNFTELFIYGGIAAILLPVFNIFSISILLILIAGYDMYAVWKSKHMIKLAKFQTSVKSFAGLHIPYKKTHAILGGGDMGFPLLFTAVILRDYGVLQAIILPFVVSLSLLFLLLMSKKNKFYPAMPILAAGCFIGFFIISFI